MMRPMRQTGLMKCAGLVRFTRPIGPIGLFALGLLLCLIPLAHSQNLNPVPVGTYLYANPKLLEQYPASLRVEFADSAPGRMVLAYGRRNRKDRKSRKDTTETEREEFKPVKAIMKNQGKIAEFPHLAPDYYDLIVIDEEKMTVHEGLQLMNDAKEFDKEKNEEFFRQMAESLSPTTDRIGGWEGFFDSKDFLRLETDGVDGAMFLQQMRKGKAYAESGALLQGTIHSIDICWVRRARRDAGWQVITRQQFYRNELPNKRWFQHVYTPQLQGIRIGTRAKSIGPVITEN